MQTEGNTGFGREERELRYWFLPGTKSLDKLRGFKGLNLIRKARIV